MLSKLKIGDTFITHNNTIITITDVRTHKIIGHTGIGWMGDWTLEGVCSYSQNPNIIHLHDWDANPKFFTAAVQATPATQQSTTSAPINNPTPYPGSNPTTPQHVWKFNVGDIIESIPYPGSFYTIEARSLIKQMGKPAYKLSKGGANLGWNAYNHVELDYKLHGQVKPSLPQLAFDVAPSLKPPAPKVLTLADRRKADGLCPDCGESGKFKALAMVCSKHGIYG